MIPLKNIFKLLKTSINLLCIDGHVRVKRRNSVFEIHIQIFLNFYMVMFPYVMNYDEHLLYFVSHKLSLNNQTIFLYTYRERETHTRTRRVHFFSQPSLKFPRF